jgi:hypothetical protein
MKPAVKEQVEVKIIPARAVRTAVTVTGCVRMSTFLLQRSYVDNVNHNDKVTLI